MKTVIVPKPSDDTLITQLSSLYSTFKGVQSNEVLEFDLAALDFFGPLLTLPLSAYMNTTWSVCRDGSIHQPGYLNTVRFPKGVDNVSEFEAQFQKDKSYIPISILKKDGGSGRERLESLFSNMVYKVLGSIPGAQSSVFYPITELVTNIFEHSKQDTGFAFGQFYPTKQYLDICIVDRGRGLTQTYKEEAGLDFSDEQAIAEVMRGHSTKPEKDRGYGVRTSKRVICEALHGSFVLISGSSALVSVDNTQRLVTLDGFYWQGVIVAYRIPKPTNSVDIGPYLE